MSKTLYWLIKTSGNTGAAGQSFKNHVTAAAAGSKMTDYVIGTGTPVSDWTPAVEGDKYASGTTFAPYVNFANYGSQFHDIRADVWTPNACDEVTVNSVSWNEGLGRATMSITIAVDSPPSLPYITGVMFWYTENPYPWEPVDSDPHYVEMIIAHTGGGTADEVEVTPKFDVQMDGSAFNAQQTITFDPILITTEYPGWDDVYEFETHEDSNYNSPKSYGVDSYVDTTYSVWLRYRIRAEYNGGTPGSWVNYGEVAWTDPREDI